MSVDTMPCRECGAVLRLYYLKNGVCNGCRNPSLVVTAMISHTPGPWEIHRASHLIEIWPIAFASMAAGTITEANARLIAAAPEMLAALK